MESNLTKTRRPWLAALLSLSGFPIGQLYAGKLKRAVLLGFMVILLIPLVTFSAIKFPVVRPILCFLFAFSLLYPILLSADAFILTRRNRIQELKRFQRWWVYLIVMIGAVFLSNLVFYGSRFFVAEAFVVPGRAMAPAVNHNDRILVDKLWFDASKLQRNDLAVFYTSGPDSMQRLMRVIGLPGENIEVRNEQVFIDGVQIEDEYASLSDDQFPLLPELANFGPVTIPSETYFVLGDNRRVAGDSRIFGPIPFSSFRGIARVVYWSNDYSFDSSLPKFPREEPAWGAIRWDRIGRRLD